MKKKDDSYVLVNKLSEDIKELEGKLETVNKDNLKLSAIRNIRIFGRFIQMVAPYLVAAALVFTAQSFLIDIPFYQENIKSYKNYMVNLDSKGVISYQDKYEDFDGTSEITIYSKWEKEDDEFYSRTIRNYSLRDYSIDEVKQFINKDTVTVEDILGEPKKEIKEHKNILTEEELNNNGYMEAVKYYEDTDDFIIIQQEAGLNVVLTILYLLITFGCEIGVAKFRYDVSDFSFSSKVNAIKRKYPKIDRKLLEKKLNIKRQTYNRLVGGKNE